MTLQRALRDCPKCGAHRGFACHSFDAMPSCPQLEAAEVDPALTTWANWAPPLPPGSDHEPT